MFRNRRSKTISYLPHIMGYENDGWICYCGNSWESKGFYTCDAKGNHIQSIDDEWDNLYACYICGLIIRLDPPVVIGRAKPNETTEKNLEKKTAAETPTTLTEK